MKSSATTVCERGLLAVLVLAGCVAEPDGLRWNAPYTGSIGDDGSSDDGEIPPPQDGGKDDDGGPPKPTDGGSSSGDVEDVDGSSSGEPDDTTGDAGEPPPPPDDAESAGEPPGDPGEQPPTGPWSSCDDVPCANGMGCLQGESQGAACTVACAGADPASCPAAPGDIVEPICLAVGGDSVCALDCTGGLPCPTGMVCVLDNDDDGPIEVCL